MPSVAAPSISLLYPPAAGQLPAGHAAPNEADLGLAAIVRALDPDGRHGRFIATLLAELRMLGARTILVTHLHDLVEDALALDRAAAEQAIVSLVAGMAAHSGNGAQPAPTYRIAVGQPQTLNYAAELAHRHGLGRAQIAQVLRERGVAPEGDPPAP